MNDIENSKIKHLEKISNSQIELNLEDITNCLTITDKPCIILNRPNEAYYKLYKIAKEKAKQHNKESIIHYLEANRIKNTHHLDELDDSDNDDIETLTNIHNKLNKTSEINNQHM